MTDYELKFCPVHGTMTNHKNGVCMKTPDVPGDHSQQLTNRADLGQSRADDRGEQLGKESSDEQ